mmetsp:Transcript_31032/g.70102  ORF Transcript_31032/g.70102 Transcript_31032/m.70102 type:complete len:296 (-) Transcript_31032:1602-2489(-)
MSATPVGYLYTPQQLMGSVKYGSGVLLGNWREDDALDEMRLMDYVEKRDAGDLVLLKQKGKLAPQLAPVALTSLPSDGLMRCGDVVLLKSQNNSGALAVSLGQHDASNDTYAVFACDASKAVTRNAIKISNFRGADGDVLCYGQKVTLGFSADLAFPAGTQGLLASCQLGRSGMSSQVIAKQEAYVQLLDQDGTPSYDCAWELQPEDVDARVSAQGQPVAAGMPFIVVHCFTNRRLAGVMMGMPSDFGLEQAVCCHTFTEMGKVNKLRREATGMPTSTNISRSETEENIWAAVYA